MHSQHTKIYLLTCENFNVQLVLDKLCQKFRDYAYSLLSSFYHKKSLDVAFNFL